jgi:hypothetical protein
LVLAKHLHHHETMPLAHTQHSTVGGTLLGRHMEAKMALYKLVRSL